MNKLLQYLKPYKKQCILGPFCKLMEAILELLLPTLMAYMINEGILRQDQHIVYFYSILMIVMVIIGFLFSMVCQYQAAKASQGFGTDIRNAMFSHICQFSYQDIDYFQSSSLVNRLSNDVNQLQLAVAMMIRLVIRSPFICIGAIGMAMFLDTRLAFILLATIPMIALILFAFIRLSTPMYQNYQKLLDRFSMILDDNISGIRIIRSFVSQKKEKHRFQHNVDDLQQQMMSVARLSALLNPITALIVNGAVVFLIYTGLIQIKVGNMQAGTIIAFINYAASILLAMVAISNLIVIFTKAWASAQRVSEVLSYEPTIQGAMTAIDDQQEIAICFQHVSFSYSAAEAILNDLNFTVQKGEMIGIIGGTGAGKSTLIHLLCHFFQCEQGSIQVFGKDINDMNNESLMSTIALVPQINELLFYGTIEDNIRFGYDEATSDDIWQALSISQADDFVKESKDGLQTIVERSGANLSGGQKQRLCIARALLRKPAILILDDASSALDFKTDAQLRQAMKEQRNHLTTLIVSQRAGTLMNCDRILVLHDGKIKGFDTHKILFDSCKDYRMICDSQGVGREGICPQKM